MRLIVMTCASRLLRYMKTFRVVCIKREPSLNHRRSFRRLSSSPAQYAYVDLRRQRQLQRMEPQLGETRYGRNVRIPGECLERECQGVEMPGVWEVPKRPAIPSPQVTTPAIPTRPPTCHSTSITSVASWDRISAVLLHGLVSIVIFMRVWQKQRGFPKEPG